MVTRKYVGGGFSWIPNAHLRPSISSTKSSFFGRVWHWSSWKKERGRGKGREGVRGKRGGAGGVHEDGVEGVEHPLKSNR